MFFISQLGEQDCAFACLKMMLANCHHDKNYLYLPCDNKSYSFQDLITIGKEYNLTLVGAKINDTEELFKCKEFPLIVTLQRKKGVKHSVLLLKANNKYVTIYDPALGKRKMHAEVFIKEWTFRALVATECIKTKCPKIFPDFIAKKDKISLPILQTFSGLSLIIGTYFIDKKSLYVIPIIFLTIFIVTEIVYRMTLVKAMKRTDEMIFSYQFRRELNYMSLYKDIERYRQISLSNTPSFINSCLIILFISIIFVMNSVYNSIYVFLSIALAGFEVFLYNPFFRSREIEIEDKESDIEMVENDFQFKSKSNEIHSSAYQLAINKYAFRYLEIALVLITIVLTMTLSGVINITYVVFFLCITIFLKDSLAKVMEYANQSVEVDYMRARLINSIELDSNIS